jgi:hypothetical protein
MDGEFRNRWTPISEINGHFFRISEMVSKMTETVSKFTEMGIPASGAKHEAKVVCPSFNREEGQHGQEKRTHAKSSTDIAAKIWRQPQRTTDIPESSDFPGYGV